MTKRVQAGDALRIGARTWNALVNMLGDAKSYKEKVQPRIETRSACIIDVENASGDDRSRFHVLGIDGPVFPPSSSDQVFQERPRLRGIVPTSAHAGRFAILLEPAVAGAVVPAVLSGVSNARVRMQAQGDTFCDVEAGDATRLISGSSGGAAAILWAEDAAEYPATVWAVVRIGAGGGAASGVGHFALKAILSGSLVVQRLRRDGAGWIEDGEEIIAYPMPGRVAADYDGLQWPGDDYADGRFIPVQGQQDSSGAWAINMLIPPFDLRLPSGADTGA